MEFLVAEMVHWPWWGSFWCENDIIGSLWQRLERYPQTLKPIQQAYDLDAGGRLFQKDFREAISFWILRRCKTAWVQQSILERSRFQWCWVLYWWNLTTGHGYGCSLQWLCVLAPWANQFLHYEVLQWRYAHDFDQYDWAYVILWN